jgi:hypothetical protein
MENINDVILQKLDELRAEMEAMKSNIQPEINLNKAAFTQKEIVKAIGLKGEQRGLLDYMKKQKILHSPICQNPLIYPGDVVRRAIKKISGGKVSLQ